MFFVTPTAYLGRDRWTMPFDDAATNARLALYLRGQASAFNGVGQVWAPKYRQATFGAFLTAKPDAARALDFAYADVVRAFAAFVAAVPPGTPIVLAGHSQGSRHLLRLVAEHVAGTPLAKRVVAVYAVGWPVGGGRPRGDGPAGVRDAGRDGVRAQLAELCRAGRGHRLPHRRPGPDARRRRRWSAPTR